MDSNQAVMKAIYIQKLRGQITEKVYAEKTHNMSAENSDLESKIADLNTQLAEIGTTNHHSEDKKTLITKYKECRRLTKDMVSTLIDYIEVGKRDPVTKHTTVIIHWSF